MSNGTNNKCFTCDKTGHFAKYCKENKASEVWCCELCNKEFTNKKECESHVNKCEDEWEDDDETDEYDDDDNTEYNDCCFRCGREGHYATSCYASKHIRILFKINQWCKCQKIERIIKKLIIKEI
jgi:hypothetical protein